ncbi:MAG TPA: glutamine-hydrolyzing GMP synthase [Thermomicrobiales bacterium]|nr:glutamine-hydrolyzing GMP synthase [Thermomicrobiales bacterium]
MAKQLEAAHLLDLAEGTGERVDAAVVLDFGSQFSQLITRRVREAGVYCEMLPFDAPAERALALEPRGVILSGGPNSVYAPGAPQLPDWVLASGLPVLGICYGMQLLARALGGRVAAATHREYGPARITVTADEAAGGVFAGLPRELDVWMSHGDRIEALPPDFAPLATSANSPCAAMARDHLIGLQFHPEVAHTPRGKDLIRNFLYDVCGCRGNWTPENFIEAAVAEVRERVGPDARVLCGLSGGVDSAVAAALIHRAIGDRLTPVFVNNGLLREGEPELVQEVFGRAFGMPLVYADAAGQFLEELAGVTDPEQKRKRIGETFVRVFEAHAAGAGPFAYLAQGTLYPDVIESATPAGTRTAQTIKTHHNVGGLPADMRFQLIEPLKFLFKDEVRAVGRALGLPAEIVDRQPFPGPGLAVRILGEVTAPALATLRRADAIVRAEIEAAGLARDIWQFFAVLLPVRTVGVMGDGRTYAQVCAIRAVTSEDAMTADWARLPYDLLARLSNRIVNEVPGINRVVYDVTPKPPGTIEWE